MTFIFPNGTGNDGTLGDLCATWADAAYKLKELLKRAGWTVPRSSDGTTYNAAGDQITSGGSGANGMNNARAWFVIQSPTLTRQFCFQRQATTGANTAGSWRIKYSKGAGFTGGSPAATVTPSATDEQVLIGGGTDASPTFGAWTAATDNTLRFQCGADNVAGYSFFCFATTSGAGTVPVGCQFGFDSLVSGPAGDPDPYAIWLPVNNQGPFIATGNGSGAQIETNLILKGYINLTWGVLQVGAPMTYQSGTAYVQTAQLLGANLVTGKDDTVPLFILRAPPLSGPNWKGVSSLVKMCFTNRTSLNTATVSTTRDYVHVNGSILPWDGSLPIA